MMTHKHPLLTLSAAASLLAALTLTGCGRPDDARTTAGQRADTTTANAQRRSDELHADASRSMDSTRDRAAQAGQDMKDTGRSAADTATSAVSDAAITATVNAELAKDPNLSATKIDVDTSSGQVALHGSAPDAASKARATTLAQGVKGVQSVDNQLSVAPKRP